MDIEESWLKEHFGKAAGKLNPTADPISANQALELFDELADHPFLSFGWVSDGCSARTHIMCKILCRKNILPEKSWAFRNENKLSVKIDADDEPVTWWYHVAPNLSIKKENGEIEKMVIDPGLFDGPVSIKEWADIMNATPEQIQTLPLGTIPKGVRFGKEFEDPFDGSYGPYKTPNKPNEDSKNQIKSHLVFQEEEVRSVFPSVLRRQLSKTNPNLSQTGKTWKRKNIPNQKNRDVSSRRYYNE